MEPGNMYARAEAEMEKRAEEAWEAELDRAINEAYEASWNDQGPEPEEYTAEQCEAECWAMEEAIRADREWELSYQRHILALKIIFALISLSAVLLAFGI